jgi:glycosyltransferase involved in cell wall biosynthesis
MKNKRLLFVTPYYLPGYKAGGPIKSVSYLVNALKTHYEIYILTNNHDFGDAAPYDSIESDKILRLDGYNIVYLSSINVIGINRKIVEINPSIIYLNSFFSKFTQIVLLLNYVGLIRKKIIIASRGELSVGALSIKVRKKKIFLYALELFGFYKKNINFHSTDDTETIDIKKLFPNYTYCIPNLTTSLYNKFPQAKKVKNKLKIIFLSRISRKKNLLFALNILREYRCSHKEHIIFDIYGPIEDSIYWSECQKLILLVHEGIEISYKGALKPESISRVLSRYHLFLLPTKSENFGHAIVEAMQCGVIPLISDQTPWNDLNKHSSGWALSLNNKVGYLAAIECTLAFSQKDVLICSNNIKSYISRKLNNTKFVQSYIDMFAES